MFSGRAPAGQWRSRQINRLTGLEGDYVIYRESFFVRLSFRFDACAGFDGVSLFHTQAHNVSVYRQKSITGDEKVSTIISMDAKQRVVMESIRKKQGGYTALSPARMPCPRPAARFQQATLPRTSVWLKQSWNKLAIGLRTQSIQLLRDAMYRICEAYWNDALDSESLIAMHRRFQNLMTGLLAIEQLTGAVRPEPIILRPGSAQADAYIFPPATEKPNLEKPLQISLPTIVPL